VAGWTWLALIGVGLAACGRVRFDPIGGGESDGGGGQSGDDGNTGTDVGGVACGTFTTCTGVMYTLNPTSGGSAGGQSGPFSNARQGSCGGTSGDLVVHFEAPQGGSFRFTLTATFDSVLYIRDGSCTGPELDCVDVPGTDGETLTLSLSAAQNVFAIVDSNSGCGSYDLEFQGL
jgi:hypothetical protein